MNRPDPLSTSTASSSMKGRKHNNYERFFTPAKRRILTSIIDDDPNFIPSEVLRIFFMELLRKNATKPTRNVGEG